VVDDWCWFVLREKYCWLVADGWFVVREKYCWLVADKPSEQAAGRTALPFQNTARPLPFSFQPLSLLPPEQQEVN
jgi:hypothetical protein